MPHGTASRPSTSYTSKSFTGTSIRRPGSTRPRTAISTVNEQEIICAVIESRGVSPIVGIAFLNLHTTEVTLCQINDTQTYVRTIQKLMVFGPSTVLVPSYSNSTSFKLHGSITENDIVQGLTEIDRRYFSEAAGREILRQLALLEDMEAINVSIKGYFYSICCFAAIISYVHSNLGINYPPHSLRVSYSPSEGSLMIDMSTITSMELIQNLENPKSKQCLFGLLNHTSTPMGARYLRTNILQPSTDENKITLRLNAVAELMSRQELLFCIRQATKDFVDAEKVLTDLLTIPRKTTQWYREQAINRVIMLKKFITSVPPIFDALQTVQDPLLQMIRNACDTQLLQKVQELISTVIGEDISYAKGALELKNQRLYAVKSTADGLMEVARQTYREIQDDSYELCQQLERDHQLHAELKYESRRQFYIRIQAAGMSGSLPPVFINVVKQKGHLECQTLELLKLNTRMRDTETEIMQRSDNDIEDLSAEIRQYIAGLYKCCESIALLDMLCGFAHLACNESYCQPAIGDTMAMLGCRHPLREKFQSQKYIPNDVYAPKSTRFQVITGCNMSGKSTYIRSVALCCIMMQIGCFVPATQACLPILRQLFARINNEDCIEDNASTFSLEMREMASILHSIDQHSLAIIDELGRGTSPRDGLAIAIAISEALIESKAIVLFATHFQDMVGVLQARSGVKALHMSVSVSPDASSMTMHYRMAEGAAPITNYGLAFARIFPLPKAMLDRAEEVSRILHERVQNRKTSSSFIIAQKKRKLLLNLKDHLEHARVGKLEGERLRDWLKGLQNEFVNRMSAIDEEANQAAQTESHS